MGDTTWAIAAVMMHSELSFIALSLTSKLHYLFNAQNFHH